MKSGYAYQCAFPCGGQSWKTAGDDSWEIVTTSGGRAKFLGFKVIDGVQCTVWNHKGIVYAQTAASSPPPKGMKL